MEGDSSNNNTPATREKKVQLKNLLERIETIDESEDTGLQAVKDVHEILTELSILESNNPTQNRVNDATETVLDAKLVNSASNLVLKCVDAVSTTSKEYDGNEFADKLVDFMEPKDAQNLTVHDYLKLHPSATKVVSEVPPFAPLYGAYKFDSEAEPVRERQKRGPTNKAKLVETKLTKITEQPQTKEAHEQTMNFMYSVLKTEYERNGKKPIGYFRYIIDTSDFKQSVDNMFYTSFLIRDGRAMLDLDKDNRAILAPVEKSELLEFRKQNGENNQLITSISYDFWKLFDTGEGYLQHHKNKL